MIWLQQTVDVVRKDVDADVTMAAVIAARITADAVSALETSAETIPAAAFSGSSFSSLCVATMAVETTAAVSATEETAAGLSLSCFCYAAMDVAAAANKLPGNEAEVIPSAFFPVFFDYFLFPFVLPPFCVSIPDPVHIWHFHRSQAFLFFHPTSLLFPP